MRNASYPNFNDKVNPSIMAYVEKVTKKNEDYAYVIKGAIYRCKISIIDWGKDVEDRDRFRITVYVMEQSYHKTTAYAIAGECVYLGVSLKGAWDEIQSHVGKAQMPDELKELQPFIAEQT